MRLEKGVVSVWVFWRSSGWREYGQMRKTRKVSSVIGWEESRQLRVPGSGCCWDEGWFMPAWRKRDLSFWMRSLEYAEEHGGSIMYVVENCGLEMMHAILWARVCECSKLIIRGRRLPW